jgi:hypothetical protein
MNIKFDNFLSDRYAGGSRFQTTWTVEGERFKVSSVEHTTACETMIFPHRENDPKPKWSGFASENEPWVMLEVWGDKFFRGLARDHKDFLLEFLQNRVQST